MGCDPKRILLPLGAPAPSVPWGKQYPLLLRSPCRPNWGSKGSVSLRQVSPFAWPCGPPGAVVAEPCWGDSQLAGWSASPLLSSHRALRAGRSGGPDDDRGLLRVLRSHAGVTVRARICKWGAGPRGGGLGLQGARPGLQRQLLLHPTHRDLGTHSLSLSLSFFVTCIKIILSLALPQMESVRGNMRSLV